MHSTPKLHAVLALLAWTVVTFEITIWPNSHRHTSIRIDVHVGFPIILLIQERKRTVTFISCCLQQTTSRSIPHLASMPAAKSTRDSLKEAVDSACVWIAEYGKVRHT